MEDVKDPDTTFLRQMIEIYHGIIGLEIVRVDPIQTTEK